ncbi:2Fe-2S iron-sulfur cluster-binding protein [Rhodanobacter sp. PCA2]|uniref:2Fe-2S iron-sulfur cluster-binding protein n=1 Tax=Rhodanobacter sp. PCA2 TaxID=2006117 RepID=UPI0015E6A7F8|nr:2Fe-2S iron-sulfur cluster-binding protein [Rhodanobacter sp. PCA2]MBA2079238.1 (2Fe-2S)-binding protein [Rhodanobacter sp. PCA2]
MSAMVRLTVNGQAVEVPAGASVAAAVAHATQRFRRSVHDAPRAPLCGMGVCFECRVSVDGVVHVRACLTPAGEGMQVITDA